MLEKVIEKIKKPQNAFMQIIIYIISYITIFNFMYIENMYFVENVVMALGILLYIISADILTEQNEHYVIKAMLIGILAIFCYQATIGFFITLIVIFSILKNSNNLKNAISLIVKGAVIVILAVISNIVFVKIYGTIFGIEQERIGSINNIWINLNLIIKNCTKIIINTVGLFQKYAFLIILAIIALIANIYWIKKKMIVEDILFNLFIVIAIASAFCMNIMSLSAFYCGRTRYVIGALVGLIYIYIYCKTEIFQKHIISKILLTTILLGFFIIIIYNYVFIQQEHKAVNILEKMK